jgi:hypothetical protein
MRTRAPETFAADAVSSAEPHARVHSALRPAAWLGSLLALALLLPAPASAARQEQPEQQAVEETNILFDVATIERRLRAPLGEILAMERTRVLETDRSRRVNMAGKDGEPDMELHWKPVAPPGTGFNNEPRYEIAAYRFQQLFLDEPDYVVPPTVLRTLPLEEYRQYREVSRPTVSGTRSVLFLLTYWVQDLNFDTVDPFQQRLFDEDPKYARHFANANVLTHLIAHKDGNHGNVVVSRNGLNRRVFVLDSDVAFRSRASDLGARWSNLQIRRIPAATVERLRQVTRADLDAALGVVAEFQVVDGILEPVELGPNLGPSRGLRQAEGRVQFGLTSAEIGDLERRIQAMLREVDRGRLTTF